jgi:hypothetical protein
MMLLKYKVDCIWELYPNLYFALLVGLVLVTVNLGAVAFYTIEDINFGQALWRSWCCVAVVIHHTKEEKSLNRILGFILCMGGLTFFGILVGTISGQTRNKLETLRTGLNSVVVEKDHIVIVGYVPPPQRV